VIPRVYKRNKKPVIFVIIILFTIAAHITALIVIPYYNTVKEKRKDTSIFKMVDVQEFIPPPPPEEEEEEEDIIEVVQQEKIVEDVIETEQTVVEVDPGTLNSQNPEDFLPQHKISKVPELPLEKILSNIIYPPLARKQGIEAIVYLLLYIDQEGIIRKIDVMQDPGHGFVEAALEALENITCTPAEANGIPVAVKFRYAIRFTLN
jgi:protein TonB